MLHSGVTQCAITGNLAGIQDAWDSTKIKAYFFLAKFFFMIILQIDKNQQKFTYNSRGTFH